MLMLGRFSFRGRGYGMLRLGRMVVQMDMCGVPAVPMDMDVPCEQGNVAP
jgi:hypothetical protein